MELFPLICVCFDLCSGIKCIETNHKVLSSGWKTQDFALLSAGQKCDKSPEASASTLHRRLVTCLRGAD